MDEQFQCFIREARFIRNLTLKQSALQTGLDSLSPLLHCNQSGPTQRIRT